MPKDITTMEPLKHFDMGLYDSGEAEEDLTIIAERIIDITDICEETQRRVGQAVLKYGRASRGVIAQIQLRHEPGKDVGMSMHYFPNEHSVAELATDDVLLQRARQVGCGSLALAETIFEYLPSESQLHM